MLKSELVQRIAERNPHLYQRDVENVLNAIPVSYTHLDVYKRQRQASMISPWPGRKSE